MTGPGDLLQVGEQVELHIDDLTRDGQGVGRHGAQVVFVAEALPGDRLQARIVHRGRRHLQATLVHLLEPSPQRRKPPCILASSCGGCSLQPLAAEAQLAWKERQVAENLRRLAGLDPLVRPILGGERSGLGYRNRALIPLERREDGSLRAGYYRRGSHRIVNLNHCPVLDPRLDALIAPLKQDLEASDWPVDRHLEQEGGLRHLGLRIGHHSGEVLITMVSSHADLPGLEHLAAAWQQRWPEVVGVGLNLQPLASNLLLGPDTQVVRGRRTLLEQFAGLDLEIAADTFFQVHTTQAERVVPLLQEALATTADGLLLDAYCGIGTYSLPLAAAGWQVLGLELQAAAVALAEANAQRNGLVERCRFLAADVPQVLAQHLPAAQALFVDPPRKGLDPTSLAAILAAPPQRLAYLSCDPATLARDLGQLCHPESGPYALRWVQPLDFFPNTSHVETLAALERR